jgi:phosphoglycolate phosphatase-like HAD superfamily hydrolase
MSQARKTAEAAHDAQPGPSAWNARGRSAQPTATGLPWIARRVARWGMVTAGRPLRPARMLPGFLIVGAERCGTTSLFHVLRQHPAIFSSTLPRKEVHYFDQRYQRFGLGWYQCHFPLAARARLIARRVGLEPVAFEATANYMFHPLAPSRIHHDLPGVKLIVLVRDPVERAYSAHANHIGHGLETEPFERALELEDERLAGEAERLAADPGYRSYNHRHYSYRVRGHYADQLEHLERIFGRDQIHVIDSGDFFAAPGPAYDQVLGFLGLARRGDPAFTPQNARPRSPMPDSVRAALEEHYRPHDERLARWLDRPPSWRR